ncbi:hypothetical protein OEZ85_006730 [Tetradesmus obliquus]|uniref:Uncharacterized protein n=1 Tax=Tetradesmus obliquus TaxID=3088 RepID=A0ABY8TVI8_TETOB|nr:hypothetical protein OEZ85_006730 [Tetradesmus obliquus]
MQCRALQQRLLQQQQQQAAAEKDHQAAAAAAAAGDGEQPAGGIGMAGVEVAAAAGVAAAGALPNAAYVKDVIKHYLLDPEFQSFVDRVDAQWDEVEGELAAQQAAC